MPFHDWQFWIVTLAAALAAGWLLRGLWRKVAPRASAKERRATLTISAAKPPRGEH
jgi:hypothetical protein